MATSDDLAARVRELHDARFKAFEQELIRRKGLQEAAAKRRKQRDRLRREFISGMGVDLKKLDAANEADHKAQEEDLKAFLAELKTRPPERSHFGAADVQEAAIRAQALGAAGQLVLPALAASITASDKAPLADVVGAKFIDGALGSGWVFPDDPSRILVRDYQHYPNALCYDNRWDNPPEFAIHFGFVPAASATYEMTAVVAFHGFYALHCDDSWWNCRDASVRLTAQMNVHQYGDAGWKDFPPLLDVDKPNADEVTNYDRTHFLDYTTGLRAGDPVVITMRGVVQADAHGAGASAELNFATGTSSYIQPLFLSVQQV